MSGTRVLIRLVHDGQWSPVGQAEVEVDPQSGMTFLRLDLSATAQRLYVPLADLLLLSQGAPPAPSMDLDAPVAGHA